MVVIDIICISYHFCFTVIEFWDRINLIYEVIIYSCTEKSCPTMTAGREYEYRWRYNKKSKPVSLSAPKYYDKCTAWIGQYVDDEKYFPVYRLYLLIPKATNVAFLTQMKTT